MSDEDFEFIADSTFVDNLVAGYNAKYTGKVVTMGTTSVADDGTILHGLLDVPDDVFLTPTKSGRMIGVPDKGTTTFDVALKEVAFGVETITNGAGTVAHGMDNTPTTVILTSTVADRSWRVHTIGSSTFSIAALVASTGGAITGDEDWHWVAYADCAAEDIHWMAFGDRDGESGP